jgi:8-oxo-dGTP diphosphatase
MEEVGLEIDNVQFAALTNDIFEESGKHYITLWMVGACSNGEPTINAVEEVSDLGWFEWDALPHPLFLPLENLINRRGYPAEAVSVISGPK